jgi:hypothetical protein
MTTVLRLKVGRPPLHVAPLSTPQGENAIFCQNIETERIYSFLIDYHEIFRFLVTADSLVADEIFEVNDFFDFNVHEMSLRLDEFLALLCRRVEEARINLPKVL